MKPKFKHSVHSFSGKLDGLVYCRDKRTGACYFRKYVKPTLVEQHHTFGQVNSHLAVFYGLLSPAYKGDLSSYTSFYKAQFVMIGMKNPTVYSFFLKMMFALKKKYPETDLSTITIDDVLKNEYPIRTISEAMKNDLLTSFETYVELDNQIKD